MASRLRSLSLSQFATDVSTIGSVGRFTDHEVAAALVKVRRHASRSRRTSERLSHGGPAFFIRSKKCFVMFLNDHHDDGRLAIWCGRSRRRPGRDG
jgi:hypothetical protein